MKYIVLCIGFTMILPLIIIIYVVGYLPKAGGRNSIESNESAENISNTQVTIDYENSYFNDFKIEDEIVYIDCTITFINHGTQEEKIGLKAKASEDYQIGLLADEELTCYGQGSFSDPIVIPAKSIRTVDYITFMGKHGTEFRKTARLLPQEITIESIDSEESEETVENISEHVLINRPNSQIGGFYMEDGMIKRNAHIELVNTGLQEEIIRVKTKVLMEEDNGLLREEELVGYQGQGVWNELGDFVIIPESDCIKVPPGYSIEIPIMFLGKYTSGDIQTSDESDELPKIIIEHVEWNE